MKRIGIHVGFLLLGLLVGSAMLWEKPGSPSERSPEIATKTKLARPEESGHPGLGRVIAAVSPAMDENMPLGEAREMLYSERNSPIRMRSLLKNRIQMMTSDQLVYSFMNGEFQTKADIREAGGRLMLADPEGTFEHLFSHSFRLKGRENWDSFIDTVLESWADSDPAALLARLRTITRGGSQMEYSNRFSKYWARIDPAAAVRHFDELVFLRNMDSGGAMRFTDAAFANEIVRSWKQKDEPVMREYIEALPKGTQRDAFEKALKALDAGNP